MDSAVNKHVRASPSNACSKVVLVVNYVDAGRAEREILGWIRSDNLTQATDLQIQSDYCAFPSLSLLSLTYQ
jgi:hypothetical protein